ncbi:hypothetical protein [Enterococcus sp. AZ109]|uniref:aspartate-alanine antiporter-like transporter n=1 Tax=Enterococcus sp. AZ109 TaxID=2774634 RepID=UPI003F218F2E
MFFNLTEFVFNPFVLIFAAIFLGMLFGRIRIKSFCFGGSGVLFAGLFIGYFVLKYAHSFTEGSDEYGAAQAFIQKGVIDHLLFNTFLVLFVTAIGLLASNSIKKVIKKYGFQFVILGFLITFMGAATSFVLTESLPQKDIFKVSGTYSGAMTSSPSLAAALETVQATTTEDAKNYETLPTKEKQMILDVLNDNSQENLTIENTQTLTESQQKIFVEKASADVGIGHSISFPIGSIVVILSMSFIHKIFKINLKDEKAEFAKIMSDGDTEGKDEKNKFSKNVLFDVTGFALAALAGLIIGSIEIPLGSFGTFSLGMTGGALLGGLVLGSIGKIRFINFRMEDKVLQVLRTLCLEIFLAIVGLRYGFGVVESITGSGLTFVVVGFVTAAVALLSGFLVGRYVFKMNWVLLSGAICGGMTNTTGMGTLIDVLDSDDAATGYGATFPFAMIGMVLFTIILHQLTA